MTGVRAAVWSALVLAFGGPLVAAAAADQRPRLEGTFAMRGVLTFVNDVYGEHRGERVRRSWRFVPRCASGSCRLVTLERRRSERHIRDSIVLTRRSRTVYRGTGRFWVPLLCAGRVVRHGGLATETITVRVTRSVLVGTTRLATRVRATYDNPTRVNLTRCPGGIGRDAARYTGSRAGPLPAPPTAGFVATPDPASSSASFTDASKPGRGGAPIVAWSWNFGDPASGATTSAQRNPTHRYSAPGAYTVTLTVTDSYGQTATKTAQITV